MPIALPLLVGGPGIGRLLTGDFFLEHAAEGSADGYGNTYPTPGAPVPVKGYLEPTAEVEHLGSQETYVTTSRFICPAGTAIAAGDTVIKGAQRFNVIEALPLDNPRTATPSHVECKVREVLG